MKRRKGSMDEKIFRRIIDEAAKADVFCIQITGTGEPLLDKKIIERLIYAAKKGFPEIQLITNGSLLDKVGFKAILTSGVTRLVISIDDFCEKGFESEHRGLSYTKVIENTKKLISEKKRLKLKSPVIEIFVTSSNKSQKDFKNNMDYRELRNTADKVYFQSKYLVHDWHGAVKGKSKEYDIYNLQLKITPCRRLWDTLQVLWDGRVALCCNDYDGMVILGDLTKEHIMEIWNGSKLKKIRALHTQKNLHKVSLCNRCKLRMDWWSVKVQ